MKIECLDHLVLTVRNVEDACHFYSTVLGMEIIFFESGHRALSFGNQKINLHEAGSEIKPHAQSPPSVRRTSVSSPIPLCPP